MAHRRGRHVHPPKTGPGDATAVIGVFPIQKERLVKAAHLLEQVPPCHETRTRDPVDVDRRQAVETDEISAGKPVVRKPTRQPRRPAAKERRQIGEPPGAGLHRAVGIEHARPRDADVGVAGQPVFQHTNGGGFDESVGIEQQEVCGAGLRGGEIDARGEPQVVRPWQRDDMPAADRRFQRPWVALVVDDHYFVGGLEVRDEG